MGRRPVQSVQQVAGLGRRAERQHRAVVSIPCPNERLAETLSVPFGRNHRVGAPGSIDLEAFQRNTDGERRVLTDDCRTLASDPDPGLTGRIVGIAAMLPVPSQAGGVRSIRALHPAGQQFDTTTIFGTKPIDL